MKRKQLIKLMEDWLNAECRGLAWNTFCNYENTLRGIFTMFPKIKYPDQLDRLEADQWRTAKKIPRSSWTNAIPRAFWFWMMENGYAKTNPFSYREIKKDFF